MADAAAHPPLLIASARPRGDEDAAVEAEFRQAASTGTLEGWLTFIRRHPHHRLTPRALAERDRLIRRQHRD